MPSTVRAGCAAAWLGHPVPFHRCAQARSRPALAAHAHRFESMDLFQRIAQPLHVQVSR